MKKITVTQPLAVQNRVLEMVKGKTDIQLHALHGSLKGNMKGCVDKGNGNQSAKLFEVLDAYMKGWRGNPEETEDKPQDKSAEDVMVCAKFLSLHSNAKARSKDFDLSIADVRKLLKTKRCAYTGEVLTKAKQSPPNNIDRTIDRLDSDKGYVKGNVFAVSHYANSLKNALFEKESEYKTTPEFIHAMTGKIIELGEK